MPAFFYARLFVAYPQLRDMFPASMAVQQDRLVGALAAVVSGVDDLASVVPVVEALGRDHRKFTVRPEHYPMVGESLLATLAHFLGGEWTADLAADWTEAYQIISKVMIDAAAAAEATSPPWWDAEVVAHERRGFDVAVLRLRPQLAYRYRAGQSIFVETALRPRIWRPYSAANAPRSDGTIDLHVKAVPGGQLSNALVNGVVPGDVVHLGSPVGNRLTLAGDQGRSVLMLAGGTGLAPLKAVVEELAATDPPRRVVLFFGARTAPDLYDLAALERMGQALPWLTVVPVLSHDTYSQVERGTVTEVAMRMGNWTGYEVYVCGSDGMIGDAETRLVAAGIPLSSVHFEDFDADPYRTAPAAVNTAGAAATGEGTFG
ncbi:MAG TPA: globin domain-containing protein [Rugosimonospora sp.]|nr:globin domain-containing protein [Rugosimonospora sp.]